VIQPIIPPGIAATLGASWVPYCCQRPMQWLRRAAACGHTHAGQLVTVESAVYRCERCGLERGQPVRFWFGEHVLPVVRGRCCEGRDGN
jgi:hypothetical protein